MKHITRFGLILTLSGRSPLLYKAILHTFFDSYFLFFVLTPYFLDLVSEWF